MKNKIITILKIIFALIYRKHYYELSFYSKNFDTGKKVIKLWYYDFKNWGWSEDSLMMVCGADDICDQYSKGRYRFTINIYCSNIKKEFYIDGLDEWERQPLPDDGSTFSISNIIEKYLSGADYVNTKTKETMWICPVTLAVLGRYPRYIYL